MAHSKATGVVTVFGNKRICHGTLTLVNGQTTGTCATGLKTVESFVSGGHIVAYTVSGGTVSFTTSDPGSSAGTVGFIAIGT